MTIISQKTWTKKIVYRKKYESPLLSSMIENIETYFLPTGEQENKGVITLKAGDTTTVILVEQAGMRWVIKRYNLISRWAKIKRALTKSRAEQCWHYAQFLHLLGINTPAPIAYIENRRGPLTQEAYYICEFVAGENALTYFTMQKQSPHSEATQVANALCDQLKKMFQAGITHGDLKATNILLTEKGIFFIDLDAMRRHKNDLRFRHAKQKDLLRFKKNWQGMPNIEKLFSIPLHHSV